MADIPPLAVSERRMKAEDPTVKATEEGELTSEVTCFSEAEVDDRSE